MKLSRNHTLFIDGIDIRPSGVPYETYIECLKGLAQAVWDLNTDFFANIKDSRGRIKVVLLLRPDIFVRLGYQNANAKARDNAVILDWRTTYQDYRTSRIFRLIDGILSKQESAREASAGGWDHYFNYTIPHLYLAEREDDPFIGLLRYSFHRPRDIISYLLSMQKYVSLHENDKLHFSKKSYYSCQAEYSDYLLGEVRDYLLFYFSDVDFDELTGFFRYLKGRNTFTWEFFCQQYKAYITSVDVDKVTIRELVAGPEAFVQLLYSLNVIAYQEKTEDDEVFVHWCFRDRTPTVLSPKVIVGGLYQTHAGLQRALKVGGVSASRNRSVISEKRSRRV